MKQDIKTPILFLIFNRPDTTKRVFTAIRKAKPTKLYIAADGPRPNKVGEKELCQKTRKIVEKIDWDCKVTTLFRKSNLGCKKAVSSAITWFFEQEEEGIVLEDDCLPNPTFFTYCQELLEKYRQDSRIAMISGDNFQFGWKTNNDSYYYSKFCHIWGWATWRRAWNNYDVEMKSFPEFIESQKIKKIFSKKRDQQYWLSIFNNVYRGEIDTWDYQWVYSVWINGCLSILPNANLISNIGCEAGTHVGKGNKKSKVSNMPTENMIFPLVHPRAIKQNIKADDRYANKFVKINKLLALLVGVRNKANMTFLGGR